MTNTSQSLSANKLALVTGAAGIVGPSICTVLRRHGWLVVATDRDAEAFLLHKKFFGSEVEADAIFPANLDCQAACEKLLRDVEAVHGPVGLLVNNATFSAGQMIGLLTQESLDQHWRVNVSSPLFLIQAAMEGLQRTRGTVINVSSIHVERYLSGSIGYSITKAALEAASTAAAVELGDKGVRVNTLRLGSVPGTSFLREFAPHLSTDQARELVQSIMPLHFEARRSWSAFKDVCQPGEVGEVIAFLASPHAKSITGTTITLDAGLGRYFTMPPDETNWQPKEAARRWLEEKGWIPARHTAPNPV